MGRFAKKLHCRVLNTPLSFAMNCSHQFYESLSAASLYISRFEMFNKPVHVSSWNNRNPFLIKTQPRLQFRKYTLRERGLYLDFFWSVFSRIRTEYGEIRSICLYLVRMRKNMDQKNYEYGHFSSIGILHIDPTLKTSGAKTFKKILRLSNCQNVY